LCLPFLEVYRLATRGERFAFGAGRAVAGPGVRAVVGGEHGRGLGDVHREARATHRGDRSPGRRADRSRGIGIPPVGFLSRSGSPCGGARGPCAQEARDDRLRPWTLACLGLRARSLRPRGSDDGPLLRSRRGGGHPHRLLRRGVSLLPALPRRKEGSHRGQRQAGARAGGRPGRGGRL
jgi:hypothetical protein